MIQLDTWSQSTPYGPTVAEAVAAANGNNAKTLASDAYGNMVVVSKKPDADQGLKEQLTGNPGGSNGASWDAIVDKANSDIKAGEPDDSGNRVDVVPNPELVDLDCTISVSWWLYADGLGFPMQAPPDPESPYPYDTDAGPGWASNTPWQGGGQTPAWYSVMGFIEYWTDYDFDLGVGKAAQLGTVVEETDFSQHRPGDVIAYRDANGDDVWDHLALVISVDEGEITVATNGGGPGSPPTKMLYNEVTDSRGDEYTGFMGILMPYGDQ